MAIFSQHRQLGRLGLCFFLQIVLLQVTAWANEVASAKTTDSNRQMTSATGIYTQWQESHNTPLQGSIRTELRADFPDKQWWTQFHDPHLSGYIQEALNNNPGLQASVYRIDQARAQVSQSVARQLPSVSLNSGFNRIGLPDIGGFALPSAIKIFMLAFQPSFELDLFGRNRDMTQSARKDLEAIKLDSQAMLIALQGEVASAYFNLLRADALMDLQRENLALLSRVYELKRNLQESGLTSYDEVFRADRDVALAITTLTAYQQQQALFAHQLAVLTGRPPASAEQLERGRIAEIQLPLQTGMGLPSELVARRPDILASERRLERTAIDVKIARKAFLPSINLSAMLTMAGTQFEDAFKTGNLTDLETVGLKQPLFQGGRLVAGVRQQRARQREQMELYRQTILTAFREVEDQLALLHSNYENLNSNAKRQELTEKSLHLTESQYEQGLLPRLNVLQSQSEVLQYRQLSTQSKADALIATVNLYKALGGGF